MAKIIKENLVTQSEIAKLIKTAAECFIHFIGSNPYLQELKKVDKTKWAGIYCVLNCWKFPEELIKLKPDWWIDGETDERKSKISDPIMEHIESTLGRIWVSREWNKEHM